MVIVWECPLDVMANSAAPKIEMATSRVVIGWYASIVHGLADL